MFARPADPGQAAFFLDVFVNFRVEIFPGAKQGDRGGLP
jgi:hypothetical protein